jgi:hypothetical protein
MSPLPKINGNETLNLSKKDVYEILKWHLETFYGKEITSATHYSDGGVNLVSNMKKVTEDKVTSIVTTVNSKLNVDL